MTSKDTLLSAKWVRKRQKKKRKKMKERKKNRTMDVVALLFSLDKHLPRFTHPVQLKKKN
jgi:hypothetical protein